MPTCIIQGSQLASPCPVSCPGPQYAGSQLPVTPAPPINNPPSIQYLSGAQAIQGAQYFTGSQTVVTDINCSECGWIITKVTFNIVNGFIVSVTP